MTTDSTRAAAGTELMALGLIRALLGGVLAKQGLEQTVDQARGSLREALAYQSRWAGQADLRTEVAPVACALARTAVAALVITQDGDPTAVENWLAIQARTVREHQADLAVEHPADSVVIAAAKVFADELREPKGAGQAAAAERRERRATALMLKWARPGASATDHVELLLAGGWFASKMLAYAFAFEEDRIISYIDDHARALFAAGR
ncbi:hypothetical protein [Streptomyces candidus]|uniref:Uncharacterized protein n=1 Tax=Streptomyces candidus TaxID=67283 RepID=A0A7X0HNC8_9ACTN|nr:hypothetical protein [Streptomyces candidus]MBB6439579.1 hypothetical protein [Streptomyces candidus]GHH54647.1 hypothetical protein GCM10018773_57930 [Streptomyces candidus]